MEISFIIVLRNIGEETALAAMVVNGKKYSFRKPPRIAAENGKINPNTKSIRTVMYLGKIVELADRYDIYNRALHPYTQALLSAVPVPDPLVEEKRRRIILTGEMPSPSNPPKGCPFHPRCPQKMDVCSVEVPAWRQVLPGHWAACHKV